jgi:hypothetical protein
MIILDLNQVMIANFMVQIGNHTDTKIDENLFRHMILNSIRSLKTKFNNDELVIACDDKTTWRKQVFPYYKANRKKARANSELDWSSVFNTLGKIKLELKEYFHYPVIQVEGAEADDVIATIVQMHASMLNTGTHITILSGDKDFRQLQKYGNVSQYDPVGKKKIIDNNPERYLKELIIRGDKGDGVPNMLSSDDSIFNDIRQKSISTKRLEIWLDTPVSNILAESPVIEHGFRRNQILIDFDYIPGEIKDKILSEYCSQQNKPRSKIFNYLINNKCKYLIEHINEF